MMKTVLIVDHDRRLLLELEQTWAFQSWRTLTAVSPQEAIDLLEDIPIDVVVINEQMSWLEGTTLLELIRHQYPEMTQILLTADPEIMDEINSYDNGIFDCFLLPTDKEALTEAVRNALTAQSCHRVDPNVANRSHRSLGSAEEVNSRESG